MHVIRRRGWEIPEREATPEHIFLNRRTFLATTGAAALSLSPQLAAAQRVADLPDPSASLYPAKRNEMYVAMQNLMEESGDYVFLTHEAVGVVYRNTVVAATMPNGTPIFHKFATA